MRKVEPVTEFSRRQKVEQDGIRDSEHMRKAEKTEKETKRMLS